MQSSYHFWHNWLVDKFESYFSRPGVAYETEWELTSENVYY